MACPITQYGFYTGTGPGDFPTQTQWVTALTSEQYKGLLTLGYSYNIDTDTRRGNGI
jgi:hypothetical protein